MLRKKTAQLPFQEAYIIHSTPYLETKLRLCVLTKKQGVIIGIVRKPGKKKPPLQILTPLSMQISQGRNMATIHTIEPLPGNRLLRGQALWAALYFNELIYRLCPPNDETSTLFACYQTHLEKLHTSYTTTLVRQFEHQLLSILGFGLHYDCLTSNASWFKYHAEQGLEPCSSTHPEKIDRKTIEGLEAQNWQDPAVAQTSKRIFAKVLTQLLGHKALFITNLLTKKKPPTNLKSPT